MTVDPVAKIAALKTKWLDNIALQCFDPSYFKTLSDDLTVRLLRCLNSGI